ncbi:hypothetical protein [Catenulispora acidiphila]|nr:hypothetical protein [Catenulispora acidiphila]
MKLRRSVAVLVAACGFSLASIAGAAAQVATPSTTPVALSHVLRGEEQLSLQQLLDIASHKVRGTYPNATLMLADGASPTGSTRNMDEVTDWRLIYNTNDAGSPVKSLELYATLEGEISHPVLRDQPWGGTVSIPNQVGISPDLAYSILMDAGHNDPYQYVSLVKPLIANPHLQYHFSNIRGGCDGYAVNVDDYAVNPIC